MNNIDVVVLGRNYISLLSMIRAAGMAGCKVAAVKTCADPGKEKKTPECFSKYVTEYVCVKQHDAEGLVRTIRGFTNDREKVVLLPTDDWVAHTIDANAQQLADRYVFPHISGKAGSLLTVMDKSCQKQLASAAGLNVARGWMVSIENHRYTLPEDIVYPVFTKPQISILGTKRFMKRCGDQTELKQVLDEIAAKADCPILLEQYVEIEKEYGVLGLCNGEQVILPALIDKLEIGSGAHKGVTLVGKAIPMEQYPQLQEKLSSFLARIGFVGLIDIDLYESGGVMYFNELNMRLGAFGYAAVQGGVNMPGMLVQILRDKEPEGRKTLEQEVTCISEKVNLEDYVDGFCDYSTYRRRLAETPLGFIRSQEDPKPYGWFRYILFKQRIKKALKKILRLVKGK